MHSLPQILSIAGLTVMASGGLMAMTEYTEQTGDRPPIPHSPQLAQFGLPDIVPDLPGLPDTLPIPGLDDLLTDDPPLTTSLTDVTREVPLLDGEQFGKANPLGNLPQDDQGAYLATPGLYTIQLESYCLKPGTHGPGGGDGYGYAQLAGPQADIIRKILRQTANHPALPQRDVQILLWGIIAQTRLSDMDTEVQQVARQLLTEDEIDRINGGALGQIPDDMRRELFANLPDPVQRVLEAKAELREQLSRSNAAYEDLEEIAVLTGAVPRGEGSRDIPSQRWSLHPDGYFVRYFPSGYSQTRMQALVPRPTTVVRDQRDRITAIDYGDGYRLETDYDDTIGAIAVPGEPEMSIYRFKAVRLVSPDQTVTVRDRGWTFVGMPTTGEARFAELVNDEGAIARKDNTKLTQRRNFDWQDAQEANERYQDAKSKADKIKTYGESLDEPTREEGEQVLDQDHYKDGVETVVENDPEAKGEWLGEHLRRAQQAWAYATCRIANLGTSGQCGEPEPEPTPDPDPDPNPDPTPIEPGGDAAIPGNTNRQRIGISNRSL